jgi:hypothetical protein|tara:strand:- start:195 stop:806 length:612 start_codon:yes stop_codon:yes gene_type:complete
MKVLDLFSGLGGASEAMLNHGWDVLRIEKNPELFFVPNTKIMDVYDLGQLIDLQIAGGNIPEQPDLIWASPPCTDFSDGYSSPKSKAGRAGIDYDPKEAIDLVKETKRIIDMINPRYWIIENVRGSIKFLKPILGEPTLIIDSIVLWGRFPKFGFAADYKHIKDDSAWSTDPLRANKRALIPYEISNACRMSIENTKTLDYWF